MYNEADEYLHIQWVIYNGKLGMHDLVQIDRIEMQEGVKVAYLDVPYDMVGPLCFETLLQKGSIDFAACTVMSREQWHARSKDLQQEIFLRAQQRQEELARKAKEYTKRKQAGNSASLREQELYYRKFLGLSPDAELDIQSIKVAYKKAAKMLHPDSGGTHEEFCQLKEAYEELLVMGNFS